MFGGGERTVVEKENLKSVGVRGEEEEDIEGLVRWRGGPTRWTLRGTAKRRR